MNLLKRLCTLALGLLLFGLAFLAGIGPHPTLAHAGPPTGGEGDDGAEESVTLPGDVHSRLHNLYPAATNTDFRPAITFWEVLGKVKTKYVDKITDQDKLSRGAVASMLRSLHDPYSRIVSPEELQIDKEEALGRYQGMGMVLGARLSGTQQPIADSPNPQSGPPRRETEEPDRAWQLVILDTIPGSAAARSGLQPGDVISKINGVRIDKKPWSDKSIDDLNLTLNGSSAARITLSALREGTLQPVDVTLDNPGPVTVLPVQGRVLPQGAAYVRIQLFTPQSGQQFSDALNDLSRSHPDSLLLDLRDNPGGDLASAERVIGSLAPGGPAGMIDNHAGTEPLPVPADVPHFSFRHIEVLTDSGTANVAELVAAALHERAGATLAGAPTFGNGLLQTVFPLQDGWAYVLTTGRIRTARGADFNQHGLAVDRPIDRKLLEGDGAITAALLVAARPAGKGTGG